MQNRFLKSNSLHGFTLIEVLVVVVIIGIVSAFALPAMSNLIKSQAMTASANEIVSTLQSARSEAIKRSANIRVCFRQLTTGNLCRDLTDNNNIDYMYVFVDANNNERFERNSEDELYLSNKFNDSILFKKPSTTNLQITRSITFNSKGLAFIDKDRNQDRGEIGLCDSRNSNAAGRLIQITNTGRAQVSKITSASTVTCE